MKVFSFFLLFSSILGEDRTGRLLVDPYEVMRNELQVIKSEVQSLSAKVTVLETQRTILEQKNTNLERVVQQLSSQAQQESGGGVYVRWGRKTCPTNGTELVYHGYVGGSFYTATGAAADYQCLPSDPIFGSRDAASTRPYYINASDYPAYMYGAEYESNFFAPNSHDQDVPCAVCQSNTGKTTLMIPGRNQCYPGWNTEYAGYLATGWHTHPAASSYICVDETPEFIFGHGSDDKNGKLLYGVVTQCGSLMCPPYENHKPLTCVVCSK